MPTLAQNRMALAATLVRACHPEPTAAVTGLTTAIAAAAGRGPTGTLVVAATVLTGQLSIGWSNDLLDAGRDRAAGRQDKPLAAGAVSARAVAVACSLALAACVPLSFASGWRAALAHLTVVACGWAYNVALKRTLLSFLPYAVAFGLLPAYVALGLDGHPAPQPWGVVAGALLGVGAHCLNVVPDLADDLAAGIRGLPHRLGEARARVLGAICLAGAVVVLTLGPGGPVPWWAAGGALLAVVLAFLSAVIGRRRGSRLPFLLALATAAVAVALLLARGSALT